jgi:hypothetical protein
VELLARALAFFKLKMLDQYFISSLEPAHPWGFIKIMMSANCYKKANESPP